jgi:outer membrane protein assembly factor BamB
MTLNKPACFLPGVLLMGCALTVWNINGADWPQFRGPQASGVDTSGVAPVQWNVEKKENIRWSAEVPGLGHSSPIIQGDRIYVTTAVRPGKAELKVGLYGDIESSDDAGPQQWRLLAFNKGNGKVIWNKVGFEAVPKVKRHPKGSHCSSTPATDGNKIVAIFGSEGLFCFDTKGDLIWKKDLGPMDSGYYVVTSAQWGFASSPVIVDDKVIVQCDVQTNSFLAVFSLVDGKELWRMPRKDVPTWSTPAVATVDKQKQIIVNGWHHIAAYHFATGKEVWTLDGGGDIPVPTPVLGDGVVYLTSGHGRFRPMRAVRLEAKGNITPPQVSQTNASIAWVHERQGNYMQTPILVGENVYGCLDNGVMSCFDARTGELHYSERLGDGSEGFTASPVSDGKHVYFASEQGRVFVVNPGNTFSVAATNTLGETCMASPAVSNGTLFFRTRDELIAIGK